MKKAIFLDRDGVINKERKDYVKNIKEFEIFSGVGDAIKILNNLNYLVIIITNQSVVNRGIITKEKLEGIHKYLYDYLEKFKANIDHIYYCPHTPNESCSCRKPKPGMLVQASKDYQIDLGLSLFIGDTVTDKLAAESIRVRFQLLSNDKTLLDLINELKQEKII